MYLPYPNNVGTSQPNMVKRCSFVIKLPQKSKFRANVLKIKERGFAPKTKL